MAVEDAEPFVVHGTAREQECRISPLRQQHLIPMRGSQRLRAEGSDHPSCPMCLNRFTTPQHVRASQYVLVDFICAIVESALQRGIGG